ncbi:unnamed protein product [Prunus armeniaca]
MISLNWITARLGSPSWALDLALPGQRVDVIPRDGDGANCWSRISFKKKYLHRFWTEVRTLSWLEENSGLRSRGRTVEIEPSRVFIALRVLGFGHTSLALRIPSSTSWLWDQMSDLHLPRSALL